MHFGHFGSVAGFEPTKCIFSYRFPTTPNLWIDSNSHTGFGASQKYSEFKNYLQSHRCNGILDRFELAVYIRSQFKDISDSDMEDCFQNLFLRTYDKYNDFQKSPNKTG